MIKLGLSIDDDKIEEELPTLEKEAPGAGEATANKMEEVDWFIFNVCILDNFYFWIYFANFDRYLSEWIDKCMESNLMAVHSWNFMQKGSSDWIFKLLIKNCHRGYQTLDRCVISKNISTFMSQTNQKATK